VTGFDAQTARERRSEVCACFAKRGSHVKAESEWVVVVNHQRVWTGHGALDAKRKFLQISHTPPVL